MINMSKKIAVMTGGGDAPGLNAVIYALTKTCIAKYGYELIGYKFGYRGMYLNDYIPLTMQSTSGILHRGGTILYSSNKDNLFDYWVEENGERFKKDVSDVAVENLRREGVDVLCVLGGDGTLASAYDFAKKGINVVGVPKTIDNDLGSTDTTFGFDTAVNIVTENLGRLHTTAESHHRVMIVEVMGRSAGWIALHSGIAGSADVILIPEIPFTLAGIIKKIEERQKHGKTFTVIVVCEGASLKGGDKVVSKIVEDSPDPVRFGGIGEMLAALLEHNISQEVRSVALGHIQRGGETSAADRVLSCRYGVAAAKLIHEGNYNNMVCLRNGKMDYVSLESIAGKTKPVNPEGEMVEVARSLGISFGE
ncbi:MAG: ATP-dependent 6-phosphofructokinase [Defluviitaleaceae bacterium]|nr:ATP-dependent 6-phosphofructokinase [Defluviitaleaceae bacterium]